jgi:hypothetical protein
MLVKLRPTVERKKKDNKEKRYVYHQQRLKKNK